MEDKNYGIVLVTVANREEASSIARTLIEDCLASCVNYTPITSVYSWQGNICEDNEYQLIIKTDLTLFPHLEKKIKELHSYKLPEIIAIPIIKGYQPYLQWIGEVTSGYMKNSFDEDRG